MNRKPSPAHETSLSTQESSQKGIADSENVKINICTDKIVLLPASGNILGVQGGSLERPLYSIRSPEFLPVRVHVRLFGVQLPLLR